jgi:hypothetical protein
LIYLKRSEQKFCQSVRHVEASGSRRYLGVQPF